jgi:hypothetical protein
MRLTEEQVLQGLEHPDKDVRFAALDYFCKSHSTNTDVLPVAIELIERLGPNEAFTFPHLIAYLPQTAETIAWALNRLQRPAHSDDEKNFTFHMGRLLCHADPQLVQPHMAAILSAPELRSEHATLLKQRLDFAALASDQLWQRLEAICEAGKDKEYANEIPYDEAQELAEAISRDVSQTERMMELLRKERDPNIHTALNWLELFAVQMAGDIRHEPAIPLLIKKLFLDDEILSEDCCAALAKIGNDAVVQAVREAYPQAPEHFRLYTSSLFGDIHSDLAVAAGLELLAIETDPGLKIWLATALVNQFSTEAIDAARTLPKEDGLYHSDLKPSLVVACKLMAYDVPELPRWERELAERRKPPRMHDLSFPFLPPVDDFEKEFDDEPELAPVEAVVRIGRNDPCPCGSGKKYKKCCLNKERHLQNEV